MRSNKSDLLKSPDSLSELAALWAKHNRADLALRHRIGVALNREYGSMTDDAPQHKAALAAYARKLGMSQSALANVRQFVEMVPQFPLGCFGNTNDGELQATWPYAMSCIRRSLAVRRGDSPKARPENGRLPRFLIQG